MQKIRSGQSFLYRKAGYDSTILEVKMKDKIRGDYLDAALNIAVQRFPYMTDKLVEKESVYYLHRDDISMNAVPTDKFRSLGSLATGYHLLDVTFTGDLIRIAFHHALCDGVGIKPFVETLVYYYCSLKYKKTFSKEGIHTVEEIPDKSEKMEPYETTFFDVDKSKVTMVNSDGFALPETASAPVACYRTQIVVNQKEYVNTAKKYGATPGILAAIFLSDVIYNLYPNADKPVVCSMAADLRAAIGMEQTHKNCTASIYLPYSATEANTDMTELAGIYKKLLSVQKSRDCAMDTLNKQIGLFNKVDTGETLEEKREMLSFFDKMCINTYVISYLGKMQFNDFGKYVESVHLYSNGIKGLTVNMVAAGDTISFNMLQGFETDYYAKAFLAKLTEYDISCQSTDIHPIVTGKDKSYITASRQAERYFAQS